MAVRINVELPPVGAGVVTGILVGDIVTEAAIIGVGVGVKLGIVDIGVAVGTVGDIVILGVAEGTGILVGLADGVADSAT